MKNTMKAAVAMMAFGVVAFGSATASAYTPSTRCETVTTREVVDAPGTRRDRVVTTTTRECDPRRATPARPVKRVVKTSPRFVVRNGRVVYVAPRVVKTRAVVTRPRAAATRTVTTTTVKKKATPRRATTVTTTTTTNREGKTVVKTKAVKKAPKGRSRRGR